MLFSQFANHLQKLEGTSSRITMTEHLAELYRELSADEIEVASYLLQGQLRPSYEGVEFQIAIKTVIKALARVGKQDTEPTSKQAENLALFEAEDFTAAEAAVTVEYKQTGDLGTVAEQSLRTGHSTAKKSLQSVYQELLQIAEEGGSGSQDRKLQALVTLLQSLDAVSAKFIIRIILGKLRLGFSTMTMIDAISWSGTGDKSHSSALELAFQKKADIGKLAATYLANPDQDTRLAALEAYTVEVGVPIVPALCQRLNSSQEIIDKMGEVIAEPKFDGLRVQIHIDKTQSPPLVRTFTRNLEETSLMFPELQTAFESLNCQSCILDAEGIGYDPQTGQLLPFQQTITRKRKHEVAATAKDIPVRFYVFDVLTIDGQSFLDKKLHERKDELSKLFTQNEVFYQTEYITTKDPEELRSFHESQLGDGLEGAVIKQLDSLYQSGRKGWNWVKIKEEEGTRGKLKDTLDCIV
ncbi:MAG: ATP-dependent DNA ligase, partial [bacterium]|nr:ATP-dependent DNA ligase [bacterium]